MKILIFLVIFDPFKDLIYATKCSSDVNIQKMGFQLLISWADNDNISLQDDALALSAIKLNYEDEDLFWWWLQIVNRAIPCQNLNRTQKASNEYQILAEKVFKNAEKIIGFVKKEIEDNWKGEELSAELSNCDEFRVCGALSGLYKELTSIITVACSFVSLQKILVTTYR